jgi:hypothetical protein
MGGYEATHRRICVNTTASCFAWALETASEQEESPEYFPSLHECHFPLISKSANPIMRCLSEERHEAAPPEPPPESAADGLGSDKKMVR